MIQLTQERLKQVLHYDPTTGVFTWTACRLSRYTGTRAGNVSNVHGYERINIDKISYRSHRLAWLYVYGEFPETGIDHINRVKTDNRIANLRVANQAENGQNMSMSILNKSGCRGVNWDKATGRWMSGIIVNGKKINIGRFLCKEDAIAARKAAEIQHYTFVNGGSNANA